MNERAAHQMRVRVLEKFCTERLKAQAAGQGLDGGPLPAEPCLLSLLLSGITVSFELSVCRQLWGVNTGLFAV